MYERSTVRRDLSQTLFCPLYTWLYTCWFS